MMPGCEFFATILKPVATAAPTDKYRKPAGVGPTIFSSESKAERDDAIARRERPLPVPTRRGQRLHPGPLRVRDPQVRARSRATEYCELCSLELYQDHSHLVELTSRQILCACEACAVLFDGKERSKFKRVPRNAIYLPGFQMMNAQWESLTIPINLAFFFHSSLEGRMVALYPSPAGAVESLLTLDTWKTIVEDNPVLRNLQSDVEALLVNRIGHADEREPEYFIAPIDACYRLVGLIRMNWKGLSGGSDVWTEIGKFFGELRAKAEPASGGHNA